MKNWVNVTPPRETNEPPITDPKEMELYELSAKEFRITGIQNGNWYSHDGKQFLRFFRKLKMKLPQIQQSLF